MEIRQTREGDRLTIALDGQLDTVTAKQLEKDLADAAKGVTELVFDLEKLSFITSAGLRVLAIAQKTMSGRGSLKIRNVQTDVQEVFDMTGISSFLTIE